MDVIKVNGGDLVKLIISMQFWQRNFQCNLNLDKKAVWTQKHPFVFSEKGNDLADLIKIETKQQNTGFCFTFIIITHWQCWNLHTVQ